MFFFINVSLCPPVRPIVEGPCVSQVFFRDGLVIAAFWWGTHLPESFWVEEFNMKAALLAIFLRLEYPQALG